MKTPKNIDVLFVAGFGPIVRDPVASRKFYSGALGLRFKEDSNGYLYTGGLDRPIAAAKVICWAIFTTAPAHALRVLGVKSKFSHQLLPFE